MKHVKSVKSQTCLCVCVYVYIYIYIYTYTHTHTYEDNSKSFRTFIFSRETERAGGVVIGRV